MKIILILLTVIFYSSIQVTPKLVTGKYDEFNMAFNPSTNIVTGYFNSATGYDETTNKPRFTCVFYVEGTIENNTVVVKTYHPLNVKEDLKAGTIKLVDNTHFSLQLTDDHGGCWNVQPFSKEPIAFVLNEKKNWIEIRYVIKEKSNFYTQKNDSSISKAYIIKGDLVYIERVEGDWAYCNYYGTKTTTGWMKLECLNKL